MTMNACSESWDEIKNTVHTSVEECVTHRYPKVNVAFKGVGGLGFSFFMNTTTLKLVKAIKEET